MVIDLLHVAASAGKQKGHPIPGRPFFMAEGPGFEPGTTESESAVLPLNYPSIRFKFYQTDGHVANLRYTAIPL